MNHRGKIHIFREGVGEGGSLGVKTTKSDRHRTRLERTMCNLALHTKTSGLERVGGRSLALAAAHWQDDRTIVEGMAAIIKGRSSHDFHLPN